MSTPNFNKPEKPLTRIEEEQVNLQYEQYIFFTVEGYGEDDSKLKLKFKKAHEAFNTFNVHLKTGTVTGKLVKGKGILIQK